MCCNSCVFRLHGPKNKCFVTVLTAHVFLPSVWRWRLMQSRWKIPEPRLFGGARHNFLSLSASIVVSPPILFGIKLIPFTPLRSTRCCFPPLSLSLQHVVLTHGVHKRWEVSTSLCRDAEHLNYPTMIGAAMISQLIY